MKTLLILVGILCVLQTVCIVIGQEEEEDVALFWAAKMWSSYAKTTGPGSLGPIISNIPQVFAIPHLAMFDASNSITSGYKCYSKAINTSALADAPNYDIAISTAARMGIVHTIPQSVYDMDIAFEVILTRVKQNGASQASIDAGVWVGQQAFANVIKTRAADTIEHYREQPVWEKCGDYEPTPPLFLRVPGHVPSKMYGILTGDQFRSPAPNSFNSQQFAAEVEEVRQKGALVGSTRDVNEEAILQFWQNNLPMNNYIIAFLKKLGHSTPKNVRYLALIHAALADSTIAVLESKKYHHSIRPITAIRNNRNCPVSWTVDPLWEPSLRVTSNDEEYPSGSASWVSSVTEILRLITTDADKDQIFPLAIPSFFNPVETREVDSLETAEHEWSYARVLGGVHFGQAVDEGLILGRSVADYIYDNHFKPCSGNACNKCSL